MLHELTHLALPQAEHHGALFRQTFATAAGEAWNLDLYDDLDLDGVGEGYQELQEAIIARLWWRAARLRAGLAWVRAGLWLGLIGKDDGMPVTLPEHLLLRWAGPYVRHVQYSVLVYSLGCFGGTPLPASA